MKKFYSVFLMLAVIAMFGESLFAGSPRKVLVEEFTSVHCGACAAKNPKFIQDLKSLGDQVVPCIIHANMQSGTDPFCTYDPSIYYRSSLYFSGTIYLPSALVNGKQIDMGNVYSEVSKYSGQTSPISIYVFENREANQDINATIVVHSDEAITGNKRLFIAVVEKYIYYPGAGSNGETEFYWVPRMFIPNSNQGGQFNLEAGKSITLEAKIPFDTEVWDPSQIHVIAFVQDFENKEVLQAGQTRSSSGAEPHISLASTKLNFDKVSDTKTEKIEIKNDGIMPLHISDISIDNDAHGVFEVKTKTPLTIGYMNSSEIEVTFTPKQNIPYTANLKIKSDADNGSTKTISLVGIGEGVEVKPEITLSAEDLEFGKVSTDKVMSFDITNTGYADLQIGDITIENDLKHAFEVLNTSYDPIEPGGNPLKVEVKFTPKKNIEYSATLRITSNATGSRTIKLTGTGENVVISTPEIELSDNELNFGKVSKTKTMPFTIKNTGVGDLVIDNIEIVSEEEGIFTLENTEIPDIEPGKEYTANVIFTPLEDGYFYGILTIKSNADNSPEISVTLMGEGLDVEAGPIIVMSRKNIDFGTVKDKGTDKVMIQNKGKIDLVITDIAINNDAEGVFTFVDYKKSITVKPGDFENISIDFTPKAKTTYTAELSFKSNTNGGTVHTIPLNGIGDVETNVYDDAGNDMISLSIGPNPASDHAVLNYIAEYTGSLQIYVYDANGNIVDKLLDGSAEPGSQSLTINTGRYNSGLYFIVARTGYKAVRLPFLVVK